MHSEIIEIVPGLDKPLPKEKWATESDLPEYFIGEIADYTDDVSDEQAEEIKDYFVESFGGHCERDGDWIRFDAEAKKVNAEGRYLEFIRNAKLLSTLTLDEFCGLSQPMDVAYTVWKLDNAFEDKFSTYVFDSVGMDLIPLHRWLRDMKPGERYFLGGVIDYHW